MPTTMLDGETYLEALQRRYTEESAIDERIMLEVTDILEFDHLNCTDSIQFGIMVLRGKTLIVNLY